MKCLLALMTGVCVAPGAWAQSSCSSDGQMSPASLVERFINADCQACWSAPQTIRPERRAMAIDWIVPGSQGEDAPLSAAAGRDAKARLDSLGLAAPAASTVRTTRVSRHASGRLRVVHGVSVGDYLGATIEWRTRTPVRTHEPLSAWLLLVETIAAGTEGTPVERNLVRNVLVSTWDKADERSASGEYIFRELRPLNIPQGAKPQRLRVLGWVQNARGHVLSSAQSVCVKPIENH